MKSLFTLLCLQAATQPNIVLFLVDDMERLVPKPKSGRFRNQARDRIET